jgi:ssDNA-binding Zn-finger/Zn-ribbon topoisomerase 1
MTDDIKCPVCGSETTLRTVKKGADTGKQFYVCNSYPECKGRVPCTAKHSVGSLFKRKHKPTLSELQGVPEGTFRCDVCKFVQPFVCLCGAVADKNSGWDKYSSRTPKETEAVLYELCGVCAIWLGFGKTRFLQGVWFGGFSDEQHEKINALHKELEIREDIFKKVDALRPRDFEGLHELNSQIQNFHELNRLRWSMLPEKIRELSDKLTRGERVEPSEISSCQKKH